MTGSVAVIVCRGGELPLGADEAAAEAGGEVIVAGQGAAEAASSLVAARRARVIETGAGLRVAALAAHLAPLLADVDLVVLPASPDGRDLAPRLAAVLDRPLLAGAVRAQVVPAQAVRSKGGADELQAVLWRLDGRLELPVRLAGAAVVTLAPGVRSVEPVGAPEVVVLDPLPAGGGSGDVEVLEVLEPDAATMDLAEAPRVVAGGAGLVPPGADDATGRAVFDVLARVAAALGASTGATRVVTDAGWMGVDRQIGTTGITLDPQLYVALGISGAVQHLGGIGMPEYVVSVNTDASCPMTTSATFALVTDARALLAELAARLGVDVPPEAGLPAPGVPAEQPRQEVEA